MRLRCDDLFIDDSGAYRCTRVRWHGGFHKSKGGSVTGWHFGSATDGIWPPASAVIVIEGSGWGQWDGGWGSAPSGPESSG